MLTARSQDGTLTTLPEKMTGEALKFLKSTNVFYCPCCETELIIKAGTIKIPHFAHKRNPSCTASSEAESNYHLSGKRQIFKWLQNHSIDSQLEAYLPKIKQRADILVTTDKGRYAFEFQCSIIPEEDFVRRTKLYQEIGITPIWILAEKNLRKDTAYGYNLSAFHWLFLNDTFDRPLILTFCPDKGQMGFLQHFTPFSTRSTFASFDSVKLTSLTPWTLPIIKEPMILKSWLAKRKVWSLYSKRRFNRRDRYFFTLYLNRLSPATLPLEIGLPVRGMWAIETPAVKWQGWLYLEVLRARKKGDYVTFGQFLYAFRKRQKSGDIRLRSFALMPMYDSSKVIKEYLNLLVILGHLVEETHEKYYISKLIQIPHNGIDVENLEKSLYSKLTK